MGSAGTESGSPWTMFNNVQGVSRKPRHFECIDTGYKEFLIQNPTWQRSKPPELFCNYTQCASRSSTTNECCPCFARNSKVFYYGSAATLTTEDKYLIHAYPSDVNLGVVKNKADHDDPLGDGMFL